MTLKEIMDQPSDKWREPGGLKRIISWVWGLWFGLGERMLFVKVRHGLNKEDWNQLDHHHQRGTKVPSMQPGGAWRQLKPERGQPGCQTSETSEEWWKTPENSSLIRVPRSKHTYNLLKPKETVGFRISKLLLEYITPDIVEVEESRQSTCTRMKRTCTWDSVAWALLSICTCSGAHSPAAATGAFTGSLGRNTSEERVTRACPRTSGDQGGRWGGRGGWVIDRKRGGDSQAERESSGGSVLLEPSVHLWGTRGPRSVPQRAAALYAPGSCGE